MIQKFGYKKEEYERHPDAIANKYTLRCMTVAISFLCVIWVMNMLNIFMVEPEIIARAVIMDLLVYLMGMFVFGWIDLRKSWVKYLVIFWSVLIMTILTSSLTFHAYLVCVMPIIFSSMYCSKAITWWGYFWTVVGIAITVYVGFENGVCDANMVLLTGKPLAEYIGENGEFILTEVNNQAWTLPLFFIVPRSIICLSITLSCSTISNIVRNNIKYAQELEKMAEIDEMTGVYNRNKYLSMTSEGYNKEDKLAVIFWDVNYLKQTNDTLGHEKGDLLIKTIGKVIKNISNQYDQAYRIGGDEFVMIMRGGDEVSAKKKIEEWKVELSKQEKIGDIPLSASYGYAFGAGKDLEEIIHQADDMMYENKRLFHEENKNINWKKGE